MIVRHLCARQSRQLLALNRQAFIPRRFSSTKIETPTPAQTIVYRPISEPGSGRVGEARKKEVSQEVQRRSKFQRLGSSISKIYKPEDLIRNPPSPSDITLELLLANQTHLGHTTSRWNPRNARYIYGIRDGIHIISLDVTAAYLRRAAKVVEEVAARGGLILFAGTRPDQKRIVVRAAELSHGYHIFERWIPGSLTNGEQILGKCQQKVVNAIDEEQLDLKESLADRAILKPDLVVCLNPLENEPLLHECGLNNVPTIGVLDTDADPTKLTYPIPANDDSLRSIALIAGVLGRAGEAGHQRRLQQAKKPMEKKAVQRDAPQQAEGQDFFEN
ncbi:mitochondrial 37S ribosomal protein uS2m [Aspergillus mulundensis]|uniref:Ribosomal protein S2 n=1 Tax=Aspergillus mulundensis TaxID=1810919 RepID=A0A3D8T3Z2_9EURO|nr:hypothetical protein DSM5745_00586 [Aspergillus mulundensis]RDW93264.1 hypothetical protein DSM5745_00586 [Aspergillus mulundensis]